MALLHEVIAAVPIAEEIPHLLANTAGGSVRRIRSGATEFLTAGPHPAVFARMKVRDGLITLLEPGPALSGAKTQAAFIERLRSEAAITSGEIVSSRILFSERPLKGAYRGAELCESRPALLVHVSVLVWTGRRCPAHRIPPRRILAHRIRWRCPARC